MRSLLKAHFFVPVFLVFLTHCRLGDLYKRRKYGNNQTEDENQNQDEPILVGVPILYEQRKYVAKELGIDPRMIMGNMQDVEFQDHYPESTSESSKSFLGGNSLKREKRGIIWNKIQRVKKGIQRVQKGIVSVRNRITKLLKGATTGSGNDQSTEKPKYPTTAGDGGPKWKGGSSSSSSGSAGSGYSSTGNSGGNGWGQSGNSGGYSGSNSDNNNGGYEGNNNQGGYSRASSHGVYTSNDNQGSYSSNSNQAAYPTTGGGGYQRGYTDNNNNQGSYEEKPSGYSTGSSQNGYIDNKAGTVVSNGNQNQGSYARKMQQNGYVTSQGFTTGSSGSTSAGGSITKNIRQATSTLNYSRGDDRIEDGGGASAVGHSSSTSTSKYPSYSSSYTHSLASSKKASAVRSARELEMIAQRFDKSIKRLKI